MSSAGYKEESMLDVRGFGAVGDGTADDTSAVQAAFGALSADSPGLNAVTGSIYFPRGVYRITQTLTYTGHVGNGLVLMGDTGLPRGGHDGSVLKWEGATGGTMMDLRAINGSRIQDLVFNGGRKAKYLVRAREYKDDATYMVSSGLYVYRCFFMEPENANDSILFAAGTDNWPVTLQASEYRFFQCYFQGVDLGAGTQQGWGFKALSAGNTKNFAFHNCVFSQLYRGVECGSGYCLVVECNGSNIGYNRAGAALFHLGGNDVLIQGGGFENGGSGYAALFCHVGQATCLTMNGCYIAATAPSDDYIVHVAGPASIRDCDFEGNSRPGSNVLKIQASATESAAPWGGVEIVNCKFRYNKTAVDGVPVYDGSNNFIGGAIKGRSDTDYSKNVGHKLRVFGNVQGLRDSNVNEPLPDLYGDFVGSMRDQVLNNDIPSGCRVTKNVNGFYVITVPHTVFAAAPGGVVMICGVPEKSKIVSGIADTTTAFAGSGLTGTIELQVGVDNGTAYDEDSLLLAHDVKTTTRKGTADADLGINLARHSAVCGGYFTSWTAQDSIKLKMTASLGSLAKLSEGSVTVYLQFHRLGP
jgi:hypothetical protein